MAEEGRGGGRGGKKTEPADEYHDAVMISTWVLLVREVLHSMWRTVTIRSSHDVGVQYRLVTLMESDLHK